LGLNKDERYQFREKFGSISLQQRQKLEHSLEELIYKYGKDNEYYAYSIVSLSIGIEKNFLLYDGKKALVIDEISTVRKRLKTSMANSVPFYIYSNQDTLSIEIRERLKEILFEVFK
jgi:hypothetical protein